MTFTDVRLRHSEAIEQTIDDIIETVLADSHVEHLNDDGPPVSTETWLAVKAHLLALVASISGE